MRQTRTRYQQWLGVKPELSLKQTVLSANENPFLPIRHSQPQFAPAAQQWPLFIGIVGAVLSLHIAIWYSTKRWPTPPQPQQLANTVVIELLKPQVEQPPEPKAVQPKQAKPLPVKKNLETTAAAMPSIPAAAAVTAKAKAKASPSAVAQSPTVATSPEDVAPIPRTEDEPTAAVTAPAPAPTTTASPEQDLPVTEAKGYAGYLSNPAPDYPEIALERGWQGSVLLRVKVSASGSPISVELKHSSGRKVLDDAAIRTVKRWKFSPAMRGSTAIDGWVDVPIDYHLPA